MPNRALAVALEDVQTGGRPERGADVAALAAWLFAERAQKLDRCPPGQLGELRAPPLCAFQREEALARRYLQHPSGRPSPVLEGMSAPFLGWFCEGCISPPIGRRPPD